VSLYRDTSKEIEKDFSRLFERLLKHSGTSKSWLKVVSEIIGFSIKNAQKLHKKR
jgi:hypothetical protein